LSDKTTIAHDSLTIEPVLAYVELRLVSNASLVSGEILAADAPETAGNALERRHKRMELTEKFFKWLRDDKKVKRIVKLLVKDDPYLPCDDDTIEKCLRDFDIRYLDWDKDDICIQTLKAQAPNLQELWLSWSGRNSTLHGWSNKHFGLCSLKVSYFRQEVLWTH